MAWGPAPCLTIWRNPRVLGFAGASRAATPEPEGRALIAIVLSSLLYASAATAGAAAILAFVACAVRHHQHAALAARRRTFVRIARSKQRCHESSSRYLRTWSHNYSRGSSHQGQCAWGNP